ncbi:MAG: bi-domain-containing oxidoreductase [Acidobacteriia bacterium]|nr:bi-domain-containing oxidoreductase [Terriglobia bacterium]
MKQLIQDLRTHEVLVEEVPAPQCQQGGVLVRTVASLISSGTERATVKLGSMSLVGKALERPDLVKSLFQRLRTAGVSEVVATVRAKLDRAMPLGYSAAGDILEVGPGTEEFQVGDRVACAGMGYASHAEMIWVPKNLSVRIPENVDYDSAAFVTLGSVALQGVRVAEAKIGEHVAVVGLGLVGLITAQILQAAGCVVWGIDLDPDRVALARELGVARAYVNSEFVSSGTLLGAGGADAIIITAATSSNQPIDLAGQMARDRAVVVVVGDVRVDVPREPYYKKELQVRYSRSYGPGRYDPSYEEKGLDYPRGYVRWTEKRNMQAFLDLVAAKKIDLAKLITHRFDIERAGEAYELLTGKREGKHVAILIDYPRTVAPSRRVELRSPDSGKKAASAKPDKIRIGWIGAGNFSRAKLLPALRKLHNLELAGLANATGVSASRVSKSFRFQYCTTDASAVLNDPTIDAVFIGTRHHLHGPMVLAALESGKHVFVEKPLCVNERELESISRLYARSDRVLAVGFNRRFSPFAKECKEFFSAGREPLSFLYRINAGRLPDGHWVEDPEQGHGRVIGEVCHFVDLFGFLSGSFPVEVQAWPIGKCPDENNVHIQVSLADGSKGEILYLASGDASVPKERLEVFGRGRTAICDDFRKSFFHHSNHGRAKSLFRQDKGHEEEVRCFIDAVSGKAPMPIPFQSLWATTLATFRIRESLFGGGARLVVAP